MIATFKNLCWELYEIEILSYVIQHRPTSATQLITRNHTGSFLYSLGVESVVHTATFVSHT